MAALPRGGTSLTEVLMAILVMGVGVLSVMTLFPIAILRSVQATQLTNATILARRADVFVDMFRLVGDEHIPRPREGYTTYAVIDPLGWHDMITTGGPPSNANEFGNAGSGNPVRYPAPPSLGATKFEGRLPNGAPVPNDAVPIPLRRMGFANHPVNPGSPVPNAPYPAMLEQLFPLPNPPFTAPPSPGLTNIQPAQDARDTVLRGVGLPDHFETMFSAEPDASQTTPTKVAFAAATTDLSHLVSTGSVPGTRITLIDLDGQASQIRTTFDGLNLMLNGGFWEITWTDPLPPSFLAISEIRWEVPEHRYSWLITIRKQGLNGVAVTELDCAVFFNRPTGDPEQELVHVAFAPNVDDTVNPPNYQIRFPPGKTPQSEYLTIHYNDAGTRLPPLKKGAWLLDSQHCQWYRVVDILEEIPPGTMTSSGTMSGSRTVELDRRAENVISFVMIPEGIVHVYALKERRVTSDTTQ